MKLIELHSRILKLMKIKLFHARIKKSIKFQEFHIRIMKNYENLIIPCKNQPNREIPRIRHRNNEKNENLITSLLNTKFRIS